MSFLMAGQLAGIGFACGLNLYLTVAALGILSRFGLLDALPVGLQGLGGWVVIASALALYLIEAVIDKVNHADSVWDTVHTFIRPPAAGLLALGALWGQPTVLMAAGATLAFLVAFMAHSTKAGLRMALNATMHTRWQPWISVVEDVLAVAAAVLALRFPEETLIGVGVALAVSAILAPRLWRAFQLGMRAIIAWLRTIFVPSRWRELDEMPRFIRGLDLGTPIGAAPPRGTRATLHGLKGAGAFRNGWLLTTVHGPVFAYRTLLGPRTLELPAPSEIVVEDGVWARILRVHADNDTAYTLFVLKDGPEPEMAVQHLSPANL